MDDLKNILIDFLVNDDDLKHAVSSLVRTADGFRVVINGAAVNVSLKEA